jgi:anti-anti-sigma factor
MSNVHIFPFHGELDIARKAYIEQELEKVNSCGPQSVAILDLSGIKYIDSSFLNALIHAENHKTSDRAIRIVASGHIERVFTLTALDRLFPIFADLRSACGVDEIDSNAQLAI